MVGAQNKAPILVKSRTDYIVEVMGCSVVWCSKLQVSITTSTMEIEYTAFSRMTLRAAIPMMAVSTSIDKRLGFNKDRFLTFKATINKNNIGALTLATLEPGKHTPRSKIYVQVGFVQGLNPTKLKQNIVVLVPKNKR